MKPAHRLAQRLLLTLAMVTIGFGLAAPALFTDPVAYPAAWPDGTWWPYTMGGEPLFDEASKQDLSTGGTTPTGSVDLVRDNAAHYYGDGDNIFLRFGIGGPPMSLSGSSQPFKSATWTVLMDTNGDGFRDFAIMLSGIDSSGHAQPDDIIVMYSNEASQSLDPATQTIWRQDAAVHPSDTSGAGADGEPGGATDWDADPDPYVWDFGRTRVTQRDQTLNPGSNNSLYWLDLQLPTGALDATSRGGPALTSESVVRFAFTSANSNTNPAQKDFTFVSAYIFDDLTSPLPSGDAIDLNGNTYQQPIISSVHAGTQCSASVPLHADVAGVLESWGSGTLRTDVREVTFHAAPDPNANGLPDDGQAWSEAGTIAMTATSSDTTVAGGTVQNDIGPWATTWDPTSLPSGQYVIKAVATNVDAVTTDSADTDSTSGSYNPATQGSAPVVGTFVNTCGAPLATLTKAADRTQVTAGASMEFTLTLDNPRADTITIDSLTDHLPEGFTYTATTGGTLSATSTPTADASGSVTWAFSPAATVPAGGSETLTFTATAPSIANTYSNTAEASASVGTLASNVVQIGVGTAALTLSAASDLSSAAPGQVVTYTLTYANDSPVLARDVVLTATLPDTLVHLAGGTFEAGSRTISWNAGDLPSGDGPYAVTFQAEVVTPYPSDAPLLVVVPAEGTSIDTTPAATEARTLVSAPAPDLTLDLTASDVVISPGGLVTLSNAYENVGGAPATAVSISTTIPAGFSYSSTTGGGVLTGNTVTWNLGPLAAGASGTTSLTLQADASYASPNPQTHTSTLTSAETSPVSKSVRVGVSTTLCEPTTWYFTRTLHSGATNEFTATTAAPSDPDSYAHVVTLGTTYQLALKIYQDPPNEDEIELASSEGATTTNIDTTFYITKENSPLDLRAELYDLDPATGTKVLLGADDAATNAAMDLGGSSMTNQAVSFSVELTGVLSKGHVLVWEFYGKTQNTRDFTFLMDGTSSPSQSYYCVNPPADLVLDARADTPSGTSGDTVTFTHDFGNSGQSEATGSVLDVTLPAGLSFGSATLNGASVTPSSVSGQTYSFTVNSADTTTPGFVSAMENGELVLTATIDAPAPGASELLTTNASLTSDQTGIISDAVTTRVLKPELSITKSVDTSRLLPGGTATYTLEIINSGNADATNVTVSDDLPETPYYTYTLGSATQEGTSITPEPVSAGVLSTNVGALAPGSSVVLTYQMQVATSGVPDGITTLASAATVDADTVATISSDAIGVSINSNPILRLATTVTPTGPVDAGETLTYTVTVSNIGASDAHTLRIRGAVPTSTSYLNGSLALDGTAQSDGLDGDEGHFSPSEPAVLATVPDLPAGASTSVTYQVRVHPQLPAGTTRIVQDASVTAGNAAGRTASSTVDATAAPSLTLVQSAPLEMPLLITQLDADASSSTVITVLDASHLLPGESVSINGTVARVLDTNGTTVTLDTPVTALAGDTLLPVYEYALAYSNRGTADASDVGIDMTLPAGVEYLAATPGAATAPVVGASGTITWTIGDVPVGNAGSLTVQARPAISGTHTSSATITSTESASVDANEVTVNVGMLRAQKSTSTDNVTVTGTGARATYTISVENTLPSRASGLVIRDVLPSGFTFDSVTSTSGGTCIDPTSGTATPTWTSCSIPGNTTLLIEFVVDIATSVPSGTYDNDVTVESDDAGVMQYRSDIQSGENVTVANESTGSTVSGALYHDADASHALDGGEGWASAPTAHVNLLRGTSVVDSVSVPAGTGTYTFDSVADGPYTLIVTNDPLATTPEAPSGWLFLEPATGQHALTVSGADVTGLHVGLFHGTRVEGTIFEDHGHGGGTANDATQNGHEPGAPRIHIEASNGTDATRTTTTSDGTYSLLVPASWGSDVTLSHDAVPGTGINDGASAIYTAQNLNDRAAASVTIDATRGATLERNFGIVHLSSFVPDQIGQSLSPGSVTYAHLYRPGTLGTTLLSMTGTFSYEAHLDADCDGTIERAERTPVDTITVDASWPRSETGSLAACSLEVRVIVPTGENVGKTDIATITGTLTWAASTVEEARAVTDTTTVQDVAELSLRTRVRNVTTASEFASVSEAKPGETLEYCTGYQNISADPLTQVEVRIPVPFHTALLADAYGSGHDLMVSLDGVTSYATVEADGDAATLDGDVIVLARDAVTPSEEGELCLRTVIH